MSTPRTPTPAFPMASLDEIESACRQVITLVYAEVGHPRRRERLITALRAMAVEPFPGGCAPSSLLNAPYLAWSVLTALVGEEEVSRATMLRARFDDALIESTLRNNRWLIAEAGLQCYDIPLD